MKENDNEFQELLSAYLDGELSPGQMEKVQHRLAQDERARALLEDLKKVSALLGALPREKAPVFLAEEVQQEIERAVLLSMGPGAAESTGRNHLLLRKLAAVAAMVMLLGAIGTIIYSILGKDAGPAGPASSYTVPHTASRESVKTKEIFRSPMDSVSSEQESLTTDADSVKTGPSEVAASAPDTPELVHIAKGSVPLGKGEYGSIHLVLFTRNMDSSLDRIEQLFSASGVTSLVRTDTEGQRQYAFLCSKVQLSRIYPDLNQAGGKPLMWRIASEGKNDEDFPLADVSQVFLAAQTRGSEAQKQLAMSFSQKPRVESEIGDVVPEESVEAWLNQMIAQARPEIKDLRNLGDVSPEIPCDACPKAASPLPAEDPLWSANRVSAHKEVAFEIPDNREFAGLPESAESEMIAVVLVVKEEGR